MWQRHPTPNTPGAYQVRENDRRPGPDRQWWAWWSGEFWGGTTNSKESAEDWLKEQGRGPEQELEWLNTRTITPVNPTPPPEPPMNEILQALETVIRRIVAEEMAKAPEPKVVYLVDDFADRVKAACLDQTWFDNAISSEVVEVVDAIARSGPSEREDIDALTNKLFDNSNFEGRVDRRISETVRRLDFTVRVD